MQYFTLEAARKELLFDNKSNMPVYRIQYNNQTLYTPQYPTFPVDSIDVILPEEP